MATLYAFLVAIALTVFVTGYFLAGIGMVAASKTRHFCWLASERYWKRCDMGDKPGEPDIDLVWPLTLVILPALVCLKCFTAFTRKRSNKLRHC